MPTTQWAVDPVASKCENEDPNRSKVERRGHACANLLKIETAQWHFLRNPAVAPTNNAAERALRGFEIKRKLSFFTPRPGGASPASDGCWLWALGA